MLVWSCHLTGDVVIVCVRSTTGHTGAHRDLLPNVAKVIGANRQAFWLLVAELEDEISDRIWRNKWRTW
jgi:hypothetical protein